MRYRTGWIASSGRATCWLREQLDRFDENNATPFDYATAAGTNAPPPLPNDQTRAAEFAKVNGQGIPTANTTEDRDRLRLRARLGMLARLSDEWSGGVRLATGSNSDRCRPTRRWDRISTNTPFCSTAPT